MSFIKKISSLTLALVTVLCVFASPVSVLAENAEDEAYMQSLKDKGFPDDYLPSLLALHKTYKDWTFEPLLITEISRQQGKESEYTWDYVVYQEYDAEVKRNLCSRSESSYRDFSHTTLYDSGWYKASRAAVEYEMDPRNFLTEKSIFRFLELSWADGITLDAVAAAVSGTFMENTTLDGEYSDTTYAEFFYNTGKEIGVNPVFLASRIRQEQGTGKSPLITGACGDRMWYYYDNGSGKYAHTDENGNLINAPTSGFTLAESKKYNGYYNYFNMGSSGTGYFQIFTGGMNEAIEGTPVMASEWGGNPSWNTRWKALYGGSLKVKEKYISVYQNIPYLQKFNVDARSSKNFWGQYMQNVTAATSEGNTMYRSYAENGFLDTAISFLIPVYEGMPKDNCPLPDGSEFVSGSLLNEDGVESYEVYDLKDVPRNDGLVMKLEEQGITWRVVKGTPTSVIDLGRLNLSKYDYVYIDYSTKGDFKATTDGKRAGFGLSTSADKDFASGNEDEFDIDYVNLKSGNGDDLWRRTAKLSLDTSFIGDVYLAAYMPGGDEFLIHNIVFVTETGHTGTLVDPEAETEAPETDTVTEADVTEEPSVPAGIVTDTPSDDEKGGGISTMWIIAIIVTVVAAVGVVVFFFLYSKKSSQSAENK